MDTRQVAGLLARTELFSELDEATLLRLAEQTSQMAVPAGTVVFVQDEFGDRMFVIAEGSVRLVIRSRQGEVIELARRSPPEVFGELALLDGGPRSASAETAERTRLVVLSRREVLRLLRSEEDVLDALLRSLGALVRRANRQTTDLVFLTVTGRVAGKLLELAGWRDEAVAPELAPVHVVSRAARSRSCSRRSCAAWRKDDTDAVASATAGARGGRDSVAAMRITFRLPLEVRRGARRRSPRRAPARAGAWPVSRRFGPVDRGR